MYFHWLLTLGVPARDIFKGFSTKLVEIDQHLKHQARRVEIRALEARYHREPAQVRQLEVELRRLLLLGRRHAYPRLGLHEELPAEGRRQPA